MGGYKGYTPAQSKAHSIYISKKARIEICTSIEDRDAIQAHAQACGESVNGFIKRAIAEAMERDKSDPGAAGELLEAKKEDA